MTLEVDNNHNHILNGDRLTADEEALSEKKMATMKTSTEMLNNVTNLDASFDGSTTTEPRKRTNSSELLSQAVEIARLHTKTDEFIKEIMAKTDQFKAEVETLLSKSRSETPSAADHSPHHHHHHHKKSRGEHLREKVFEHRESILTELFKISHIRTFRHVFISLLIIICFQILVFDYTNQGKLNLDFELLNWCFSGFGDTMLYCWLPMQLFALYVVYYVFKSWAYVRNKLDGKSNAISYSFIALYALYILLLIYLPLYMVQRVSVACRLIILIEQVRLLMKTHAFVRTNIPRVQSWAQIALEKNDSHKPKSMDGSYGCPAFSKYLYFMFAPTLVYRDEYPLTRATNWRLVLAYFAEIMGSIIYTYCLFDRFCVPVFREVRVKQLTMKSYLYLISISILPGALMHLMVFFSLLHSWHNMFAEMLRFGDRQFYLDWWNSTSYNAYYRTWNTLVHDWLYAYIYQDLYRLFGKNYRALCQFGVIFISSVFHEHILSFAFGFFYPVLFVLFTVFGFVCLFIPRGNSAPWNVFIWTSLFTGIGIQLCLFSIEWYARRSDECPRVFTSFVDYILPRSIFCLENFF